jgi:predicted lipid-binding transport protein (Tim44 family)
MASRIGHALYWMGTFIAVLLVGLSIFFALLAETNDGVVGAFTAFVPYAVLAWVIGRACRYFLART